MVNGSEYASSLWNMNRIVRVHRVHSDIGHGQVTPSTLNSFPTLTPMSPMNEMGSITGITALSSQTRSAMMSPIQEEEQPTAIMSCESPRMHHDQVHEELF